MSASNFNNNNNNNNNNSNNNNNHRKFSHIFHHSGSCDNCRRAHRRCDRRRPHCSRCREKGIHHSCRYTWHTGSKIRRRANKKTFMPFVEHLQKHLERKQKQEQQQEQSFQPNETIENQIESALNRKPPLFIPYTSNQGSASSSSSPASSSLSPSSSSSSSSLSSSSSSSKIMNQHSSPVMYHHQMSNDRNVTVNNSLPANNWSYPNLNNYDNNIMNNTNHNNTNHNNNININNNNNNNNNININNNNNNIYINSFSSNKEFPPISYPLNPSSSSSTSSSLLSSEKGIFITNDSILKSPFPSYSSSSFDNNSSLSLSHSHLYQDDDGDDDDQSSTVKNIYNMMQIPSDLDDENNFNFNHHSKNNNSNNNNSKNNNSDSNNNVNFSIDDLEFHQKPSCLKQCLELFIPR